VLIVILILLLLAVCLTVLLWVGAVSIQGFFYNDVSPDLIWRAPTAAVAITLYIAVWCWIAHGRPQGTPGSVFDLDESSEADTFPTLVWIKRDQTEVNFHRVGKTGTNYRDSNNEPWKNSTTDEIVMEVRGEREDGTSVTFKADLTPKGKLKNPPQFIEEGGRERVMTADSSFGSVPTPRRGLDFAIILLNGFLFVACFLVLWLLMRFQWSHALGLALPLWLTLEVAVVPFLMRKVSGSG
jgi:hypothetical protein